MSKIKCNELETVDGTKSVSVADIVDSVILKSPNGTPWRIKVANDGTLSAEKISTQGGTN